MATSAFNLPAHLGQPGSCIVCLAGTDTGLAFAGSREWLAAGLTVLGVPQSEAVATVEQTIDGSDRSPTTFRVCTDCVRASGSGLPGPALIHAGATVPCVWEPK